MLEAIEKLPNQLGQEDADLAEVAERDSFYNFAIEVDE